MIGATALGVAAVLIGRFAAISPKLLLGVCLLGALADFRIIRVPESRWQVPKAWARFGRHWFAFAFGAVMGFGLLTAAASAGLFAVVVWAAITQYVTLVMAVFALYVIGRTAPFAVAQGLAQPGPALVTSWLPWIRLLAWAEGFLLTSVAVFLVVPK